MKEWLILFRQPFTIMRVTGVIMKNTTFPGERLDLINRKQSCPPTGTRPSPSSVSVWKLDNNFSSLSSTSRLTLCTHWSLMSIIIPPHWVVARGFPYSCDSRIGFGTGGMHDNSNTCGNEAVHYTDNGHKHIKAMGYILVQWERNLSYNTNNLLDRRDEHFSNNEVALLDLYLCQYIKVVLHWIILQW